MPNRALLRQPNGPPSPLAPGRIASAGTCTSSITTSPVVEARSDSLPCILGADSPFSPFSSTKPRITPSSSLAQITKTSAIGAFDIHILEPLSTQPSATFFARVFIPPGSEPWSGSVSPKQPIISPVASLGRYFSRCSSEP